jgi:hypothetical protein
MSCFAIAFMTNLLNPAIPKQGMDISPDGEAQTADGHSFFLSKDSDPRDPKRTEQSIGCPTSV